jgi:hypothetical protein
VVPSPSSVPAEQVIEAVFAKLDAVALGTAIGVVSGLGLFLATVLLLLKGGDAVGPTLSLLAEYLIGFEVTWKGALVGLLEAGLVGFILGYLIARLRNWSMAAYSRLVQRRAQAEAERELLDKV